MSGLFARVSQRITAPHTTPRAVLARPASSAGALENSSPAPEPVTAPVRSPSAPAVVMPRSTSEHELDTRQRAPGTTDIPEPATVSAPSPRATERADIVEPAASVTHARTAPANERTAEAARLVDELHQIKTAITEKAVPRDTSQALPGPQLPRREDAERRTQAREAHAIARRSRDAAVESAQQPIIHVTIDRMEVQAPAPVVRAGPPPASRAKHISLEQYLGGSRRR